MTKKTEAPLVGNQTDTEALSAPGTLTVDSSAAIEPAPQSIEQRATTLATKLLAVAEEFYGGEVSEVQVRPDSTGIRVFGRDRGLRAIKLTQAAE